MNGHEQETITGLLDGELTRRQRRRVLRHLRSCPQCTVEYRRQRRARRLLRDHAAAPAMPVSGEAFWNQVRAAIDTADAAPARPDPAPIPTAGLLDWLRGPRWVLVPVTVSLAIMAVVLVFAWRAGSHTPSRTAAAPPRPDRPTPPPPVYAEVERAATVLPDTSVTAFNSETAGVTVLWVDGLPWTEDLTEMQTLYASLDS